jgi:YHS domain-containing protein
MKLFIASIVASLALFGCSSKESSDQTTKVGDPTGVFMDSTNFTVATDPVSGEQVRTDSGWKTYWRGNWYYFDSEENLRKFESTPTAYVTEDGRLNPERQQKVRPSEVR